MDLRCLVPLLTSVLAGCVSSTVPPTPQQPAPGPVAAAAPPGPRTQPAPAPVAAPPVTVGIGEASPAPPTDGGLSPELRARFAAIRSDPAPAELVHDSHYWISNEHSHFVWHAALEGIGGAYLGVGTDQNYLLAGWARAELLLLVDFDAAIVELHDAYRVAFETCETPAEFLRMWTKAGAAIHTARIVEAYPEPDTQARVLRAQKRARTIVHARLRKTLALYAARGIPTYLDDQAQYDHLRALWRGGRVYPIRGDLTGDATLVDAAAAIKASGLPLAVLYLSNAEQYFDYGPGFRRNMIAQPMDAHILVLRTLGWHGHGFVAGEQYHYSTQSGANFAAWMQSSRVLSAGRMLAHKRKTPTEGVSVIDAAPARAKVPPEIAGAPS